MFKLNWILSIFLRSHNFSLLSRGVDHYSEGKKALRLIFRFLTSLLLRLLHLIGLDPGGLVLEEDHEWKGVSSGLHKPLTWQLLDHTIGNCLLGCTSGCSAPRCGSHDSEKLENSPSDLDGDEDPRKAQSPQHHVEFGCDAKQAKELSDEQDTPIWESAIVIDHVRQWPVVCRSKLCCSVVVSPTLVVRHRVNVRAPPELDQEGRSCVQHGDG